MPDLPRCAECRSIHDLPEIVVIGVDGPTVAAIPEPIALWHRELGEFLGAWLGRVRGWSGLDLVLPDRSYTAVAPDLDRALVDGILKMRQAGGIVLAITTDAGGQPRPVHAPFLAAAGPGGAGYALWRADPDRIVRRFDERLGANGESVPTFSGQLARALQVAPGSGGINYTLGEPFDVLPLIRVLAWARADDKAPLRQAVGGKVVLVGTTLPFIDRVAVPARARTRRHPGRRAPRVCWSTRRPCARCSRNARCSRCRHGWQRCSLAQPDSRGLRAGGRIRATVTVLGLACAGLAAGVLGARSRLAGCRLAAIVLTGALAAARAAVAGSRPRLERAPAPAAPVRGLRESAGNGRDRDRPARRHGEHAPLHLRAMMDLRGFTARSERESPARIVAMLNAWCEEATAPSMPTGEPSTSSWATGSWPCSAHPRRLRSRAQPRSPRRATSLSACTRSVKNWRHRRRRRSRSTSGSRAVKQRLAISAPPHATPIPRSAIA